MLDKIPIDLLNENFMYKPYLLENEENTENLFELLLQEMTTHLVQYLIIHFKGSGLVLCERIQAIPFFYVQSRSLQESHLS